MQSNIPSPMIDTKGVGCGSKVETRAAKLENLEEYMASLGDDKVPDNIILNEKPIHVAIAYMMVAGRNRKEIAFSTGTSEAQLTMLAKQPWFKERVKTIGESSGKDLVKSFLEGEVIPSLVVLQEIRDDATQKGATRVSACNSILDRFLGKPVAHIESKTNLNIHTAADAAEQVESELEKIDRELHDRGVNLATRRNN